jgi:type VI secretion system protein ImpB
MAQQGTIAPKERVNIVYRPSQGDAQEEIELPLKMLVLGDFSGHPDDRPIEQREPVSVNKDNFDDILNAHQVTLNLSVTNRLSTAPGQDLQVQLRVASLKDFAPDAIAEQVPELKRLLELREALRALKGPLANVPEFRKKLQDLLQDDSTRQRLLAETTRAPQEEL